MESNNQTPAPVAPAPETPAPTPPPAPAPVAPASPAPPPVAHAGLTGARSERELELERRLKARETEIAERDDRLRTQAERLAALERPPATPAPKPARRFGFFSEED